MDKDQGASGASRIAIQLMNENKAIGLPALKGATGYATEALDKGLPAYVNKGYEAAAGAAMGQSVEDEQAARVRALTGRGVNAATIGSYQGAGTALAKERAGQAVSKAAAGVTQRNQLLNVLMGGGASATQLGTSFGGLTNRALASGLNAGNSTYEAVVGGSAAVSPLLLDMLSKRKEPIPFSGNSFASMAASHPGVSP